MWGPTFSELVEALPGIEIIDLVNRDPHFLTERQALIKIHRKLDNCCSRNAFPNGINSSRTQPRDAAMRCLAVGYFNNMADVEKLLQYLGETIHPLAHPKLFPGGCEDVRMPVGRAAELCGSQCPLEMQAQAELYVPRRSDRS
jgi:hypothetical protein